MATTVDVDVSSKLPSFQELKKKKHGECIVLIIWLMKNLLVEMHFFHWLNEIKKVSNGFLYKGH